MRISIPKNASPDVRLAIQNIASELAEDKSPTFSSFTLSNLTASTLVGANASKVLESVTIGTGLDYTRPTLSLSHLGIESLSDPDADKIVFWDDSASACKWLTASTGLQISTTNLSTKDSEIDHNSLKNYASNQHFLQTAITNVSTALSTGLLKVTTGTGALSVITDSSTNWDAAYTHVSNDGTDHSYIDQDLQTSASPTFAGLKTESEIFIKEQAAADDDQANYGQVWVKNTTPNELWFTDDAGTDVQLGAGGTDDDAIHDNVASEISAISEKTSTADADLVIIEDSADSNNKKKVQLSNLTTSGFTVESSDRTVNLDNTMSTAEMQAEIDAIGKYIVGGVTITVQFADGEYDLDAAGLEFDGFIGSGALRVLGNRGEVNANALHTTQSVYLNHSDYNGPCINFIYCSVSFITIYNLKLSTKTDSGWSDGCCAVQSCSSGIRFRYSYCLGTGTGNGSGFYVVLSPVIESRLTYYSNMKYGILSQDLSGIFSRDNDDTGVKPDYGLFATHGGEIAKRDTQPTGGTANELTSHGGEIR